MQNSLYDMTQLVDDLKRAGITHVQRTQWHVQVPAGEKKFHNIWVNSRGQIRVQIDGVMKSKPLTHGEWMNLLTRFGTLKLKRRQTNG